MRPVRFGATILVIAALLVLAHLAFIEVGREVITLRTTSREGVREETRLWIVDDGDSSWLHSAGVDWARRFEGDPLVEVVRAGETRQFRARAMPGPHARVHQLLREKYGLADRWVRLIGPDNDETLAVRLDPP